MRIENEYLKVMELFRIENRLEQSEAFYDLSFITVDEVLKEKLITYSVLLKELPQEASLKVYKNETHSKTMVEAIALKRELISYVEKVINGEKEYWQIIAEQRGWTPPVKEIK